MNNEKKLYFVSDDLASRKAKLIKTLTFPDMGLNKHITTVYKDIRLPKDKEIKNIKDMENVIKNTFKNLQRTLKKEKAPLRFALNWSKDVVAMTAKSV